MKSPFVTPNNYHVCVQWSFSADGRNGRKYIDEQEIANFCVQIDGRADGLTGHADGCMGEGGFSWFSNHLSKKVSELLDRSSLLPELESLKVVGSYPCANVVFGRDSMHKIGDSWIVRKKFCQVMNEVESPPNCSFDRVYRVARTADYITLSLAEAKNSYSPLNVLRDKRSVLLSPSPVHCAEC